MQGIPTVPASLGFALLLLASMGIPETAWAAPAGGSLKPEWKEWRLEVLPSAGIGIPDLQAGLDVRLNSAVEVGARMGVFPLLAADHRSFSGHVNLYADNSDPMAAGTWFYGTELAYAEERSSGGYFETTALNLVMGREHRMISRLRFAYAFGGGFLFLNEYRGGGAPIMLPISLLGRIELRLQAF